MNGGNFGGFRDWEDLPLEQFWLMLGIHNAEVERQNREIEAARGKK